MFLIIRLAVQNFNVDGMSMEPNLHDKELILVDKWSYRFHAPNRGDVIVFVAPPNPAQDYVKRIIGMPGDIITIQDTTVFVNGKQLAEPYIDPARQGNPYASIHPITNMKVPPGAYFVLGDNRNGSSDSRDWGCVPTQNVIGRAALVYWPLGEDNNGLLRNVSSTFSDIPAPPAAKSASTCQLRQATPATSLLNNTAEAAGTQPIIANTINLNVVLLLLMPALFVAFTRRRAYATQSAYHKNYLPLAPPNM
ncbi:MAG: signal peptidase I [Ktedonobacteraceae bacterium]|nr:signal peptidase I [Ktedonobacteraceae bacterium]